MWGFILLIFEILKTIFTLIIKGLKLWWSAMLACFGFFMGSVDELKNLHWENENDRSKIIKNGSIIAISVVVVIFLIWLLIHFLTGGFVSSNNKKNSLSTQTDEHIVETTSIYESTIAESIAIEKKTGWTEDPSNLGEILYYDENSIMVVDKDYKIDGNWYRFDSDGHVIKNQWYGDYYYGSDGKMLTNQWIDGYYVGSDGAYMKSTITPDGKMLDAYGHVIENTIESTAQTIEKSTIESTTIETVAVLEKQQSEEVVVSAVDETVAVKEVEELYIRNTVKSTDFYEYYWTSSGGTNTVDGCDIYISRPVVAGIDQEEVSNINNQLLDLEEQLNERLKDEDVLSSDYRAITSVNLNKSTIEYTNDLVTISLTGQVKYTTEIFEDSPSSIKFIIEYDRKEGYSKMHNQPFSELGISSQEIFYAE